MKRNGFSKFVRKLEGLPVNTRTMADAVVGDRVNVRSMDVSSSLLGSPVNYVGEVRVINSTRYNGIREVLMYDLGSGDGCWYVAEDLELVE